MRATGISGASGTAEPRNQAAPGQPGGLQWARQDSNLGPTDYESAALTAELRARPAKGIAGWTWTDPPAVSKNTDLRILS